MKILISDKFSPEGLKVFEEVEGLELVYHPGISPEELLDIVVDIDALVVRGGTHVTEEVLDAAKKLRVIGRAGIGIENIDISAANRKGVVVINTPFGSTTTTAEHTITMMMALARQIPEANYSIKSGKWEKDRFLGVEISGKTLGVIGGGKIGRLVVERALGLKMHVLIHDPYLSEDVVRQMGAEQVEFDEILERADFLTLHLPLKAETHAILDEEALARVKPGCRIINCATGGLIDENALTEALRDGRVAGAALDVFAKEPPDKDNPLLDFEQVVCTPHLRAATLDAQINVTVQIARQIVDFLKTGVVGSAVNVPSVGAELLTTLGPYLELAERLGSFQAQFAAKGLTSLTVEYAGSVAEHPTDLLTNSLLKGFLTPMLGPVVNDINAPHLARERGVRVVEARSPAAEGFSNLIRLTIRGTEGEHSVCGALFSKGDYRIVRVDDFQVEAIPCGHILVLHNDDRPGVIAFVGQVLAENNINIAMMNLSRRKIKGKAITLINVDSRVPEESMEALRGNEHILSAIQVKL